MTRSNAWANMLASRPICRSSAEIPCASKLSMGLTMPLSAAHTDVARWTWLHNPITSDRGKDPAAGDKGKS
jgi:hypothetical protein